MAAHDSIDTSYSNYSDIYKTQSHNVNNNPVGKQGDDGATGASLASTDIWSYAKMHPELA